MTSRVGDVSNDDGGDFQRKKLVVVGDGFCGKTSMLLSFTKKSFPENYIPTVCEASTADVEVDGVRRSLILWDTAGQEDYDRLRPVCYGRTDVLVVCFTVNDRNSFDNARLKWVPEVRHFCPQQPILLVATKIDLRPGDSTSGAAKSGGSFVSAVEGSKLATDVGADMYVECSAKTREGIELVFEVAARLAFQDDNKRRKKREGSSCSLL